MKKVAFLLYDRALVTGVSLAAEMLNSASRLRTRSQQKQKPLNITFIGPSLDPIAATAGLRLQPDITYDDEHWFDTVILPPMWGNPIQSVRRHPGIIRWLQRQYQKGANLVATGTGVVWLAETGLLNHLVATTHWYYYDNFSQRYPKVILNRKASITEANGLYCTTSINSQSELILYFIAQAYGQKIAVTIETHFGHEISKTNHQPFYQIGGQIQFDESIALAQDWMRRNLSQSITAQSTAEHCQLPLRTFNRKFTDQVGETPHKYLQRLRMETAQQLLRDVGMSIQEVAEQVGYQDSHHFSTRFQQHFQMSPSQYRRVVKAKIYNA